jgi:uncharacterized protein (DUF58 family)
MEFEESRLYQLGDDVRSIDWRVTARSGKLHTKLFHEELERPVLLLVDGSPSMRFGTRIRLKSVQACRYAALAAWSALRRGDRIGAIFTSPAGLQEVRPGGRHPHLLSLLRRLSEWHNALLHEGEALGWVEERYPAAYPLHEALRTARRLAPPGSLIYIISDWIRLDTELLQLLGALKRHHDLRAVQVLDELEEQLPDSGTYPVQGRDPGSGEAPLVWLDCGLPELRAQHELRFREHQQHLQSSLRSHGVPLISLRTQEDVHDLPLY